MAGTSMTKMAPMATASATMKILLINIWAAIFHTWFTASTFCHGKKPMWTDQQNMAGYQSHLILPGSPWRRRQWGQQNFLTFGPSGSRQHTKMNGNKLLSFNIRIDSSRADGRFFFFIFLHIFFFGCLFLVPHRNGAIKTNGPLEMNREEKKSL